MNWVERAIARRLVTSYLRAHWGTIAAVAGPLVVFEAPSLRVWSSAHPHTLLAVVIASLLALYHSTAPKDR